MSAPNPTPPLDDEAILPPVDETEVAVELELEAVEPERDPDLAPTDDPAAQLQAALHDLKLERASFQTYRARIDKEKADIRRYGGMDLARDLLRVLDYFEMSLTFDIPDLPANAQGVIEGVKYTVQELHKVLEQHDIRPLEVEGQPFDPAIMEAVGTEPREDVAPNTVLAVATKGYTYKDRILRPARVVVASGSGGSEAPGES